VPRLINLDLSPITASSSKSNPAVFIYSHLLDVSHLPTACLLGLVVRLPPITMSLDIG
jgi:hypothetical protein